MSRKAKHEEHENHERWLVSYADFITLLFAFFVVMYSVSSVNEGKFRVASDSIRTAINPVKQQMSGQDPFTVGNQSKALVGPLSPKFRMTRDLQRVVQTLRETNGTGDSILVGADARGVVVSFADSALFESGQVAIRPAAIGALTALAEVLMHESYPLLIEGHTDTIPVSPDGPFPTNWELSAIRATAVARLLTERLGLPPQRLGATGYGEWRPVANNDTPEGRAKNRRVDLIVEIRDANAPLIEDGEIGVPILMPGKVQPIEHPFGPHSHEPPPGLPVVPIRPNRLGLFQRDPTAGTQP